MPLCCPLQRGVRRRVTDGVGDALEAMLWSELCHARALADSEVKV
jgi:hypothetical protein